MHFGKGRPVPILLSRRHFLLAHIGRIADNDVKAAVGVPFPQHFRKGNGPEQGLLHQGEVVADHPVEQALQLRHLFLGFLCGVFAALNALPQLQLFPRLA